MESNYMKYFHLSDIENLDINLKILNPDIIENKDFSLENVYNSIEKELSLTTSQILDNLTGKENDPLLKKVTSLLFNLKGKKTRPSVIFLLSRVLSNKDIGMEPNIIKLSMVAEMIHTASLMHDDVIDGSDTRRDEKTVNNLFSNNIAILGGDFILAKSMTLLGDLKNMYVLKTMSTVLGDLVEGELLQLEACGLKFDKYLLKTYLKTASMFSNCCRSVALIHGLDNQSVEMCFQLGTYIGLAFQIIDDLLDYTTSSVSLGKPALADLKLGLATAPVLFATKEFPELEMLMNRRFCQVGDVETATTLVFNSKALEYTRSLSILFCNKAIEILLKFPKSTARDLFIILTQSIVLRKR